MNEITLLIDRWLKHTTHGVEAYLPGIPRMTPEGDEYPLPLMPTITNDVEDGDVAAGGEVAYDPALIVFSSANEETREATKPAHLMRNGLVVIAYTTRDTDAVTATRDCGIVLRAVKRSLQDFTMLPHSDPAKSLNGVKVVEVKRMSIQRAAGGVGKTKLWGFVLAGVTVIDQIP